MATSLDLSDKIELRSLGDLIERVNEICAGRPFLLAGATARDLLLEHAHRIPAPRATADVDLAFLMDTWDDYHALREALLHSGDFDEVPRQGLHKLRFRGSLEVDLLPFGAIERADRTIVMPPDDAVLTMWGFKEAYGSSITVTLPDDVQFQIVSLPALAILKLVAWTDRRLTEPGKDAQDLLLIIRNYLDAGNRNRFFDEHPDAGGSPFDYETAGAWLLGRDMARLLETAGREKLASLIAYETSESGSLRLVGDMRFDADRTLALLAALEEGFVRALHEPQHQIPRILDLGRRLFHSRREGCA